MFNKARQTSENIFMFTLKIVYLLLTQKKKINIFFKCKSFIVEFIVLF